MLLQVLVSAAGQVEKHFESRLHIDRAMFTKPYVTQSSMQVRKRVQPPLGTPLKTSIF